MKTARSVATATNVLINHESSSATSLLQIGRSQN